MKRLGWLLFLSIQVYGMEEITVESSNIETYASIVSQMLLGVIFIAPAVSIGSLFAFMRFDKELKSYLLDQQKQISQEIDQLRLKCLDIAYNEEVLDLYEKIDIIKRKIERI
jgi:hypothetical protein